MNKTIYAVGLACLAATSVQAQKNGEIEYINPPAVQGNGFQIELSDIVSKEDYCKLKMSFDNRSQDSYLRYNFSKTGFHYDNLGTYYSKRGKDLIAGPGEKRSGVAEVKGNAGFLAPAFELRPEGLSTGKIPAAALAFPALDLEVGKTATFAQNGFELSVVKVEQSKKKDKVSAQIKVVFKGSDQELGLVQLQGASILSKSGAPVAEFDFNPNKMKELLTGDDINININITSTETAFSVTWINVFKIVSFTPEALAPVAIKSSVAPVTTTTTTVTNNNNNNSTVTNNTATTTTTTINTNCPPYEGNKGGKVKVNIYNEEGECFTMMVNGVMTPQTPNATLYLDYGRKDLVFTFSSGVMLQEKFTLPDTWEATAYRIKKNKKGEYVMNHDLMSVVLNEKGKALSEQTAAQAKENHDRALENVGGGNSGNNSSNNSSNNSGNSSSSNSQPEPSFSTGSTSVKLKITYKGAPAADTYITIKHGDAFVGNNKTNSSGEVTIKTNSLVSRSIDVYGERGSYRWNVRGAVALDGNNSANVDLYEIAKFMAEMMGGDPDAIGRGWGF